MNCRFIGKSHGLFNREVGDTITGEGRVHTQPEALHTCMCHAKPLAHGGHRCCLAPPRTRPCRFAAEQQLFLGYVVVYSKSAGCTWMLARCMCMAVVEVPLTNTVTV